MNIDIAWADNGEVPRHKIKMLDSVSIHSMCNALAPDPATSIRCHYPSPVINHPSPSPLHPSSPPPSPRPSPPSHSLNSGFIYLTYIFTSHPLLCIAEEKREIENRSLADTHSYFALPEI